MKKLMFIGLILASSQYALSATWMATGISGKGDKRTNQVDFDSVSGYYFNNYDKTKLLCNHLDKNKKYPTAQKLKDGRLYRKKRTLALGHLILQIDQKKDLELEK